MLNLARWKVVLCIAALLFGLVFTLPNLLPQGVVDGFPAWAPHQRMNLGLDLQGGSSLLLEVDTVALKAERLTNLTEDARSALRGQQILFTGLSPNNGVVSVRITDPAQYAAGLKALGKLGQLQASTGARDVVVTGGPDQHVQLALQDQALAALASSAVDQSIEIIRRRIDALGTREPTIIRQGTNRILVEAPGESDPERLKNVIGQTAKLTFQMVDDSVPVDEAEAGRTPPDAMVLPNQEGGGALVVKRRALVSGEMLTDARSSFDQNGRPDITFRFNGQGASRFATATAENIGKRFAIVLDGKVMSAPVIQSAIEGGSGEITGNFTPASANDLALILRSGALPAPLKVEEQRSVGAGLGADAVKAGQVSAVIGAALIFVFIILAYGLFGWFSAAALVVNGLLIVALMSVTQATLTLPGIAGLILTLAVAVDANVLIYERMRDEARAGRSAIISADNGFRRALETIIDANLTTLIAAMIMFMLGTGTVRGFAWTLFIGVVTSVFSAVLVTQVLIGWWFRATRPKKLPIL